MKKSPLKSERPKKSFLGVSIDPELRARLEKLAESEHRSLSGQAALLLATGVKHREDRARRDKATLSATGVKHPKR